MERRHPCLRFIKNTDLTAVVMNLKRLAAVLLCFLQFLGRDIEMSGLLNSLKVDEKKIWMQSDKIGMRRVA